MYQYWDLWWEAYFKSLIAANRKCNLGECKRIVAENIELIGQEYFGFSAVKEV